MTATGFTRLKAVRPLRREAPTHLFSVGQTVRPRGGFRSAPQPAEIYRITATLPPRGDSPQYRIRNDTERHERVATQDSIELVDLAQPGDDATLVERTFGHGQATETRQPPDGQSEAGDGRSPG